LPYCTEANNLELPASWSRAGKVQDIEVDVGTFADVLALFDVETVGDRFKDLPVISNQAIIAKLGINALELLPAADAKPKGEWGYATAHYFSTDYDLGTSSQLIKLVENIHSKSIRFFTDVVMAFGHDPYVFISFDQFHLSPSEETRNPDSWQSHRDGELRDGYGGRSWRYIKDTQTYDPQSGNIQTVHPAWVFHQAHLQRWMLDFGVDGLRLDSVNNIANYEFIKAYKDYAWRLYRSRYSTPSDAKFLVIGEELADPTDMITTSTLNSLWNESFQARIRALILGNPHNDDFDWTVRKMVNCTLQTNNPEHQFTDGAQAINYITSHDTEGSNGGRGKQRLFNFLLDNGVVDIGRRARFAYALLLTSVGIPMIFAGEEFCDQMDHPFGQKQIDPVNYERKETAWRTQVFNYIATMVKFRTTCPALGDNDTEFLHWDFTNGRKIMAWKRGAANHDPVVVVANFSDVDTGGQGMEYVIGGWPKGYGSWREITQAREVPTDWIGREPLMHWEVKVYSCWRG
jgi:pullulanase